MVPCIFWERGKSYTCVIHSYTLLTSHFPILSHLGFQEHKLPARYLKLRPGENFEGCNRTVEDLHWITWDNGESVIGCEWLVYVLHCNMAIWGIWCTSFQELQMHTYALRISFSGSKKKLLKLWRLGRRVERRSSAHHGARPSDSDRKERCLWKLYSGWWRSGRSLYGFAA